MIHRRGGVTALVQGRAAHGSPSHAMDCHVPDTLNTSLLQTRTPACCGSLLAAGQGGHGRGDEGVGDGEGPHRVDHGRGGRNADQRGCNIQPLRRARGCRHAQCSVLRLSAAYSGCGRPWHAQLRMTSLAGGHTQHAWRLSRFKLA